MEFGRNLSIVFTFFGKSAEVENQHVLFLLNLIKSNKHYGSWVKRWIKIMEFLQTLRTRPASNSKTWSKFKKMLLQNWRLSDGHLTAVRWLSDECPINVQWMSDECPMNIQWISDDCPTTLRQLSDYCLVTVDDWQTTVRRQIYRTLFMYKSKYKYTVLHINRQVLHGAGSQGNYQFKMILMWFNLYGCEAV